MEACVKLLSDFLKACPPLFLPFWGCNADMTVLSKLGPCRSEWNDKVEGPGSFDDFMGQKPLSALETTALPLHHGMPAT